MSAPDYSLLDAEIVVEIGRGNRTFNGLQAKLEGSAKAFCKTPKDEPFRVIDRRLQALRKKGKVGFDSKLGWRMRAADGSYIG